MTLGMAWAPRDPASRWIIACQCALAIGTSLPSSAKGQDCYANCDGSTVQPVLNVADFACFLNRFAARDPLANCDESTTSPAINVLDFACYINKFSVGCPDPAPVINGAKSRAFIRLASKQRIALVRLGDSNQLMGGYGWDDGFQVALASRYGLYATPLFSLNENLGLGSGIGHNCNFIGQGVPIGSPDGPQPYFYSQVAWQGQCTVHHLSYVSGTVSGGVNSGISISPAWPGNISGHLRYSIWTGRFTQSGGSFRPGWRNDDTYTLIQMCGEGPFPTGPDPVESVSRLDCDLAAGPRSFTLRVGQNIPGQCDIVGPFLGVYQCVSNVDRLRGGSAHTLFCAGGQGLYHYAQALITSPDQTISRFFDCVGDLMLQVDQPRRVVILIDSGLNDRHTLEMSVGPNPAPSWTAEGFADNARAVVNRLRSTLIADGWTDDEFCFVLSVSHPTSDNPEDIGEHPLQLYRAAAEEMAVHDGDLTVLNVARLTTAGELLALGYYNQNGLDHDHLTGPAYTDLAARELEALTR